MRIDSGNQGIPSVPGRKQARPARGASSSSHPISEQSSDTSDSVEASPLLVGLEVIPDVRPEVVEEVRHRLSRGEYLTRDAAEKTAAAILADLASFIGQ